MAHLLSMICTCCLLASRLNWLLSTLNGWALFSFGDHIPPHELLLFPQSVEEPVLEPTPFYKRGCSSIKSPGSGTNSHPNHIQNIYLTFPACCKVHRLIWGSLERGAWRGGGCCEELNSAAWGGGKLLVGMLFSCREVAGCISVKSGRRQSRVVS